MARCSRILGPVVLVALAGCMSTDVPAVDVGPVTEMPPPVISTQGGLVDVDDGAITINLRDGYDIEMLGAHVVALYNKRLLPKLQGHGPMDRDELALLRFVLKTQLCALGAHTWALTSDMLGDAFPPAADNESVKGDEGASPESGTGGLLILAEPPAEEGEEDEYDEVLSSALDRYLQSSDSSTRRLLHRFGSCLAKIDREAVAADIDRCAKTTAADLNARFHDRWATAKREGKVAGPLYIMGLGPLGLALSIPGAVVAVRAANERDPDKISRAATPYEAFGESYPEFASAWGGASEIVRQEADFLVEAFGELEKYEHDAQDGKSSYEVRQLRAELNDVYRISVIIARVLVYDVPAVAVLKNGHRRVVKTKRFWNDPEDKMAAIGLEVSSRLSAYSVSKAVSPYTAHVYGEFAKLLKDELSKDEFMEMKSKASLFENGFFLYEF